MKKETSDALEAAEARAVQAETEREVLLELVAQNYGNIPCDFHDCLLTQEECKARAPNRAECWRIWAQQKARQRVSLAAGATAEHGK
jgi:hypothetical protein